MEQELSGGVQQLQYLKPALSDEPDTITACDGSCGRGLHVLIIGGPEVQLCSFNRGMVVGLRLSARARAEG